MINSQTVATNTVTDLRVIRPSDQIRPQVAFDYAHARLALYVFFLGICLALVLLLPFFPSQDGPNHLYNLVILRDLLHGGMGWAHFYVPNVRFTPNLGFELFTYPLLSVLAPIRAEQVFLCFYIVLLGLAVPVFLKSFDVPSLPLSFFVFVALFNRAFLMGFFGYAIGIPVLLLALSAVWRVRHSSLKT